MNTTDKEFAMANEIDTSGTAGKIAVMQAFAEGNKVQMRRLDAIDSNNWMLQSCPCWNWFLYDYRIYPQPKTRQLRASDWDGLPVVWVTDLEDQEIQQDMLVTGIDNKGFDLGAYRIHWNETSHMQWSVDRKTWKPFTVEDTE